MPNFSTKFPIITIIEIHHHQRNIPHVEVMNNPPTARAPFWFASCCAGPPSWRVCVHSRGLPRRKREAAVNGGGATQRRHAAAPSSSETLRHVSLAATPPPSHAALSCCPGVRRGHKSATTAKPAARPPTPILRSDPLRSANSLRAPVRRRGKTSLPSARTEARRAPASRRRGAGGGGGGSVDLSLSHPIGRATRAGCTLKPSVWPLPHHHPPSS